MQKSWLWFLSVPLILASCYSTPSASVSTDTSTSPSTSVSESTFVSD